MSETTQAVTPQTDVANLLSDFKQNQENLKEATAEYLTLGDKGSTYTFAFKEFTQFEKNGKTVDVALLALLKDDGTIEMVLNGDAVLLSTIKRLIDSKEKTAPFPLFVTVTGEKKNEQGTYKTLSIKVGQ